MYQYAKISSVMKQGIHPEAKEVMATCVCGAEFLIDSVLDTVRVEICSSCHPFYAGTNKVVDVAGRIDKFKNKYNKK